MPIRPENRKRYPSNWPQISERIRRERAGNQCECCGQCGADHAAEWDPEHVHDGGANPAAPHDRCQAVNRWRHPETGSIVVLTVAHLDHAPENCDDGNLLAMCQRCHNRYDAPKRREGIRRRAFAKRAARDLFEVSDQGESEK